MVITTIEPRMATPATTTANSPNGDFCFEFIIYYLRRTKNNDRHDESMTAPLRGFFNLIFIDSVNFKGSHVDVYS
jgi:hypothetical protein